MNVLVEPSHELLSTNLEPFDFNEHDAKQIADELIEVMMAHNGLGLSANQIGLSHRVFVMRGDPNHFVCFNPRIVDMAEEIIVLEEGCLTYPDLYVKIKRPIGVRVRYQDVNGEIQTRKFVGITARCFQHEMDHLNGIHYLERASKFHLEEAKKRIKLVKRRKKKYMNQAMKMMRSEDGN